MSRRPSPGTREAAAPRIEPVEELDPSQRELLAHTLVLDDEPAALFRTLVHHPELCRRINALGGQLLRSGRLPQRERELVVLRVAWRTGSAYEHGHHVLMGREAGLTDAEMAAVAHLGPDLDEADVSLLEAVDEALERPRLSDDTWEKLRDRFDPAQLLELLTVVGFYRMVAGILESVGVPLDEGLPGWFGQPGPGVEAGR